MNSKIQEVNAKSMKFDVVDVRSGDTVRVHQKIKEGDKERIQIFEGLVIRTDRKNSATSSITVRRIASGVGVEKSYMIHSPLIIKIEVTKRSKVRRNYLSYMRSRSGKSARLSVVDFDKNAVNEIKEDPKIAAAEAELKAQKEAEHKAKEAEKAVEEAANEAKIAEAMAAHDDQN